MRTRLILAFALIILITIGSITYFARQGAANELYNYIQRGGYAGLEDLVSTLEQYYRQNGSWSGVDSIISSVHPGTGQGKNTNRYSLGRGIWSTLRLADENGVLLYDSVDPAATGTIPSDELQSAISLHLDDRIIGYLLPGENAVLPGANFEQELITRLNLATRNAAIIASATALVLAVLLAYLIYRPLGKITSAAVKLGEGDLSQRVAISGVKEFASLGDTFNHMAESLELAERNRRAMTADIAHELRTPLAVQRASLEALQDGVYPLTMENVERILEQNQLLSRIVDDLRTITLAEAGELVLDREPTDLKALLENTIADFNPQVDQNDIKIETEFGDKNNLIKVDPLRIRQILHNLFQNALRYTPSGGKIQLRISMDTTQAIIAMRDTGPGIPEDDIPLIFERFYRVDRSRSRELGGSGLGLAIARKLAQAHHGTLTVSNHPEGGSVFTLTIPFSDKTATPED
jgi:signal transduction histidine kinase